MKKIILTCIIILSFWIAIPWGAIGLPKVDEAIGDYKLGLDLHGGVELDYLVDFPADMDAARRLQVIEDMKTILDGRVRRIGTTEPTLNTAQYGEETHIIVQVPTPNEFDALGAEERAKKDAEFIQEAKAVIGQVVKIQFKEPRSEAEFNELMGKRGAVVSAIEKDFNNLTNPFDSFSQKIADTNENVFYLRTQEIKDILGIDSTKLENLSAIIPADSIKDAESVVMKKFENVKLGEQEGTAFVELATFDQTSVAPGKELDVRVLFVNKEPLRFKPAMGKNGQVLDEKHLINTVPSLDPTTGRYVLNLVFDSEGQTMFGDITERNSGGMIAIFLGNKLLTAPNVSSRIDGNAIITPGAEPDTKAWATNLSKNINEGIVPVGIYEHSEQTIGPNLGKTSLRQLIVSGIIGVIIICAFILWQYRSAGLVASVCLIIYIAVVLAITRLCGITLTLAGVAGIVLSLAMAIDSNILLLERVRDFVLQGKNIHTSLKLGFREAWDAVWDSHITALLVGVILWWMGVSLITGFGQTTVIGVIVNLWVIRYICNPLTIWFREKIG